MAENTQPGDAGQGNDDNYTTPLIATIGGLFALLYGNKLLKIGGKGAKLYATVVKKSAEKLMAWLEPYWTNRAAIEREAKKTLAIWYGVTFAATVVWQVGAMLDPGLARMMVSGFSRAASLAAYFWMMSKLAFPIAVLYIATRWGAFTADMVQEPVSVVLRLVRWVHQQTGAIGEDADGKPFVNTGKIVDINDGLVYGLVMVISMISTFAVVFPSPLIQLAALASIPPLIAYLTISEMRGWDNSFGWQIMAKIPLFGILGLWAGTFAALLMPDVFGWFLEFPYMVSSRSYAVLQHGAIQSVFDLFGGTWLVVEGGRLIDGSVLEGEPFRLARLTPVDRVALGFTLLFVWALLAYVAVMAIILLGKFVQSKRGILNMNFRRRGEPITAAPAENQAGPVAVAAPAAAVGYGAPSRIYPILGGLITLVVILGGLITLVVILGGLGWIVKSIGSSSTATAPTATATATTTTPPAPPATTAAIGGSGTGGSHTRTAGRGPTRPASTVADSGDCSGFPISTNAYARCVKAKKDRADNRYSDDPRQ